MTWYRRELVQKTMDYGQTSNKHRAFVGHKILDRSDIHYLRNTWRDSWKNYVSSVNVNTPSKKVWDMIRKITGKNVASPMHHLKDDNGTLITDRVEITNTLGAAIEKSSSSNNYSKEFQSIKAQKEKQKIKL